MDTLQAINELKTLVIGLDSKVNQFSTKLDTVEEKFTRMVIEIKSEVNVVKNELICTQEEVKKLRVSHDELERGVQAMDMQLNAIENQKLELLRHSLEFKMKQLRKQQVLLEKHDRKYNVLVYGLVENQNENLNDRLYQFMVDDLGIDKTKADSIPIANSHRIPARTFPDRPKQPNPIIIRFIHYSDKQFFMSRASKLAGKKVVLLDDLPVCMKEARGELAKEAYKIRKEEKLKTRIRADGVHVILETRLNAKDKWQIRKDYNPI